MVISIWAFYAMAIVAVVCLIAYLGNKYGNADQIDFLEMELSRVRHQLGHAEAEATNFRKMADTRYENYKRLEKAASDRLDQITALRKQANDAIRERDGAIKTMDNALSNRDKISKALAKEQAVTCALSAAIGDIRNIATPGMAHIGKRMVGIATRGASQAARARRD